MAWEDHRADLGDIRGLRLSPTGAVLDAAPLALAVAPNAQVTPDLTARNGGFLAVWSDHRAGGLAQVRATRLGNTGPPLDPSGRIVASTGERRRHRTGGGVERAGTTVPRWLGRRRASPRPALAVTRLTSTAEVLDPDGIGLGVGDFGRGFHRIRDVAWNGSRFVVLFETLFTPANNGARS